MNNRGLLRSLNIVSLILITIYLSICDCADLINTKIKVQPTLYTIRLGRTIQLPCEIINRRQATVIWQFSSKNRIPETLTIGNFYYRKDFRIRVIKNTTLAYKQSWNLEIRKVKLDDEGYYYCKVMAEPESLKREIYLKVAVDMEIEPVNPIVRYDEPITIFCNTSFAKDSSQRAVYRAFKRNSNHARIIWYKDGIRLHHDSHRNLKNLSNISIHHYYNPTVSSKLRIHNLNPSTVGKYTCRFRYQNTTTNVVERNTARILMELNSSAGQLESCAGANLLLALYVIQKFF